MEIVGDTHQKALRINLDPRWYGTIAEIGAGQEVARWFFVVGGAAGTVAKTISAYDMAVSDAIYGEAPRYVSRQRLQAMLEYEFSDAWAHLELAIILRGCGRYTEALEHSTAAIRWSPPWTNAYHHRALVYTDLGRAEDALADYARVLTLDPVHLDTLSDRATLLYRLERFDAARADVARGLALSSAHARLLCVRGCLERREGRIDDARR